MIVAENPAPTCRSAAGEGCYDREYARLDSTPHLEVRRETFGEDFGQSGWATGDEVRWGLAALGLEPGRSILEVACGAGGLARLVAREWAGDVTGIDRSASGVEAAGRLARRAGLAQRTAFRIVDAAHPLPFAEAGFDAVLCWDSIDHLPRRERRLGDWNRVLRPGGRLLFTDPAVVTGPLSSDEIALLGSRGGVLVVPPGVNELLLEEMGFDVEVHDRTAVVAGLAARWHQARARRRARLEALEGVDSYERRQRQLAVSYRLASGQRLSRVLYVARKGG